MQPRFVLTQPLQILVVEDDPDTLAALATLLREEDGFAVWVARDGEQALEVAEELGYRADVVVVDLDLGPGSRGDQFVAAYRQRAGIRVLTSSTGGAAY
jgi:DNA-binding response OmpR family regulator